MTHSKRLIVGLSVFGIVILVCVILLYYIASISSSYSGDVLYASMEGRIQRISSTQNEIQKNLNSNLAALDNIKSVAINNLNSHVKKNSRLLRTLERRVRDLKNQVNHLKSKLSVVYKERIRKNSEKKRKLYTTQKTRQNKTFKEMGNTIYIPMDSIMEVPNESVSNGKKILLHRTTKAVRMRERSGRNDNNKRIARRYARYENEKSKEELYRYPARGKLERTTSVKSKLAHPDLGRDMDSLYLSYLGQHALSRQTLKKDLERSHRSKLGVVSSKTKNWETSRKMPAPEKVLYNNGIGSMQDADYTNARHYFASLLKEYPNSYASGDALYWIGESYYAQNDFKTAAAFFLEVYVDHLESGKAPNSLLKLGISLSKIGKDREACVVFDELRNRFAIISNYLVSRLQLEMNKNKCQ